MGYSMSPLITNAISSALKVRYGWHWARCLFPSNASPWGQRLTPPLRLQSDYHLVHLGSDIRDEPFDIGNTLGWSYVLLRTLTTDDFISDVNAGALQRV